MRKLIRSVDSLVVLDEAYMDFWDQSLLSEVEDYENLIILRTSSKAIGCAAIRLGFAVANERLSNALRAVKSPYNVNSFTQMAGTVLFQHKELLERARRQIICQRKACMMLFCRFKGISREIQALEAGNKFCVYQTGSS